MLARTPAPAPGRALGLAVPLTLTLTLALASLALSSSLPCESFKDPASCRAASEGGLSCSWCECKAVPSECLNATQAAMVPPSIFHCDQPALETDHEEASNLQTIADHLVEMFNKWAERHSKVYADDTERIMRFQIWKENFKTVLNHNNDRSMKFTRAMNKFSDLTHDEFSALYLGVSDEQHCSATIGNYRSVSRSRSDSVPKTIDWRDVKAVSAVKDQGSCGSCWTFSTTGALESATFLATEEMVLLSEQQLVDCAGDFNNNGCSGGLPSQAFEYIMYNGGLATEDAYPYTAKDGDCVFDSNTVGATVKSVVNITSYDEDQLWEAVGLVGPVSIAFQVASDFSSYSGGVYSSVICSDEPDHVNHAVLAVGYNTDPIYGDYWIVKNSWGTDWGLDGYFYIERGSNMCGLSDCASYPEV